MYLLRTTSSKDDMQSLPPFGPGFNHRQTLHATRMEIWSSSFSEAGPDYNIFKLFDAQNKLLHERKVGEY